MSLHPPLAFACLSSAWNNEWHLIKNYIKYIIDENVSEKSFIKEVVLFSLSFVLFNFQTVLETELASLVHASIKEVGGFLILPYYSSKHEISTNMFRKCHYSLGVNLLQSLVIEKFKLGCLAGRASWE